MNPYVIYFPQFYPTTTNNKAWGAGFTDWSLVANANLQNKWIRRAPRRGFYDGSAPEVHQEQINEMIIYGLGGLALYHYWFYTHQELNSFENSLLTRTHGLPWFMIWASEGWSKRWIGDATSIVHLTDTPTEMDIANHCDYLVKCFDNSDYLRIDGRPLFVFYNIAHFSNPGAVLISYREHIRRRGYELCIGHFVKNPFDIIYSGMADVTYLFEPRLFFGSRRRGRSPFAKSVHDLFKKIAGDSVISRITLSIDKVQQRGVTFDAKGFNDYLNSRDRQIIIDGIQGAVQDVLSPGWNNVPRYSDRFTALDNLEPQHFAELIFKSSERCKNLPPLINAWNEWSEGAAIEPCYYFGSKYLDEIAKIYRD